MCFDQCLHVNKSLNWNLLCYWNFPTSHLWSCDYENVTFKCFVVGKNRNNGGHQVYSCLFIGKKPKLYFASHSL